MAMFTHHLLYNFPVGSLFSADILESFDTHHPLVLPDEGYQIQLKSTVADSALKKQLNKLKEFITSLSESQLNTTRTGKVQVHFFPQILDRKRSKINL